MLRFAVISSDVFWLGVDLLGRGGGVSWCQGGDWSLEQPFVPPSGLPARSPMNLECWDAEIWNQIFYEFASKCIDHVTCLHFAWPLEYQGDFPSGKSVCRVSTFCTSHNICWIDWNSAVLCFKLLFHIGVWTFAWFARPLLATILCMYIWEMWSPHIHVSRISLLAKKGTKHVTAPILKPTDDQKLETFVFLSIKIFSADISKYHILCFLCGTLLSTWCYWSHCLVTQDFLYVSWPINSCQSKSCTDQSDL